MGVMVIISSERDLLMLNQRANHTTMVVYTEDTVVYTGDTDAVTTLERDLLMLNQKLIPMLLGTTHMATDMPYLITVMAIISSERDLLMLNQRANHTTMVVYTGDTVVCTVDTDTVTTLERDLLMLRANHTTVVYTVDMDTVDTVTVTVDTTLENK